jgi:hypothetical protein
MNSTHTNDLWQLAHEALCRGGDLPRARALLDELAMRGDCHSLLSGAYELPEGDYGAVIQDRIEAVNARVESNLRRHRRA